MSVSTDEAVRRTTLYVLVADSSAERFDYRSVQPASNVYWGFVETAEVFAAALRLQPWDLVIVDSSMVQRIPTDLLGAQDNVEGGHQIVLLADPAHIGPGSVYEAWPDCDVLLKRGCLAADLARLLKRAFYLQRLRQERAYLEHEIERILSGWEASVRDRTQSLERKTRELETLSELKNQFLENVSHELRAPLTVIRSYVELLIECPPDDENERREFIRTIDSETQNLSRMIDDLLDISRLTTGNMVWNMTEVDVQALIGAAVKQLEPRVRREGIAIDVVQAFEVPHVWGDRERLTQVLANLLENSVKFAGGGVVRLTTELITEESGGEVHELVQIAIEDTGPGIPAEMLERIFDRFTQARDSVRKRGAGLGLAIAREIVLHHGGRIWASNTAFGARFCVVLPLSGHLDVISGVYDAPKD